MWQRVGWLIVLMPAIGTVAPAQSPSDHVRELQTTAIETGRAPWGFWGYEPQKYTGWKSHSNRLIPVYTFGVSLDEVAGRNSVYRNAASLTRLYGQVPPNTLHRRAEYFDQTDIYRLQQSAVRAGKKHVILIVFDGMDWVNTWAAAIYKSGRVAYRDGRGTGLAFQDYRGTTTEFGYFVTSPLCSGVKFDVSAQTVLNPGGTMRGGYDPLRAGETPWSRPPEPPYLVAAKGATVKHAVTDSAASATSMCSGIKSYDEAINVDYRGQHVTPIARQLQKEKGWAIGVVTSVPISHATPAAAYANNVTRDDYQDLARDLVGLPSVAHRTPLPGVDVLLGAGWGEEVPVGKLKDGQKEQGVNFVPGNKYIADPDLRKIDVQHGGKYQIALRTPGFTGNDMLVAIARESATKKQRLFGMYGFDHTGDSGSHLPFQTADGGYDPTVGSRKKAPTYAPADVQESPTLADLTQAALTVLETNEKGFWLMIEAGDVDWANHDDNLDNAIGSVLAGEAAFQQVVRWAEKGTRWKDTAVIVTSDHGHYLNLTRPEVLAKAKTTN